MSSLLSNQPCYSVALFSCRCCGYDAEIHSSDKWVKTSCVWKCKSCDQEHNMHFGCPVIYRDDIDEEISLYFQSAMIPEEYTHCHVSIEFQRKG